MKLIIKADWPISSSDVNDVSVEVKAAYYEVLPLAQRVLTLPIDPWAEYTGTLEVVVHKTMWADVDGVYHSGLTHFFQPNNNSKIEFAWDVQHQDGQAPLRHEWGHWFALQAGHPDWGEFGHGTDRDPLMRGLKSDLLTVYMHNFRVVEGKEFPGYTPIDFSKPEFKGLAIDFQFRVINGALDCQVYDKGARVDFTKDEGRQWLWHFIARGGKLRATSYDRQG